MSFRSVDVMVRQRPARLFLLSFVLAVALLSPLSGARAGNITLMQSASKDAGSTNSTSLAFSANNTGGYWIAVCIRAGRSGEVFTVSDSRGNMYRQAAQLNVTVDAPNGHSLAIFYAENIAGGPNTITVSDSVSATLRLAIFEYSGVAQVNSLDVRAGGQGTSTAPSSGTVTTTANGDLALGVMSTADARTYTAGG